MKILKTDSYISEKLSIRPVTKDMLAGVPKYKMFKTPYDMKQNFKTGDIAIFSSHIGNESAMFVSYDDYMSDKYSFIKDDLPQNKPAFSNGIFVTKYFSDLTLFCCLSDCDDNLIYSQVHYEITKVYRRHNMSKPFKKSDFLDHNYDNTTLIYETDYEE